MDIDVLKELNLELLTERQRAVVSMTLDGKTQVEIGKELGCRQATVSRLIQYAIRRNSRILTSKENRSHQKRRKHKKKMKTPKKRKSTLTLHQQIDTINTIMECIKIGTFPYCPSARKK